MFQKQPEGLQFWREACLICLGQSSCLFRVGDHDQADSEGQTLSQQSKPAAEAEPGLCEAWRLGGKKKSPDWVSWRSGCRSLQSCGKLK